MRAAGLLVALVVSAAAGSIPCPAADGPVTCDSCPAGADVNVMSRLPRINSKGQKVRQPHCLQQRSAFTDCHTNLQVSANR